MADDMLIRSNAAEIGWILHLALLPSTPPISVSAARHSNGNGLFARSLDLLTFTTSPSSSHISHSLGLTLCGRLYFSRGSSNYQGFRDFSIALQLIETISRNWINYAHPDRGNLKLYYLICNTLNISQTNTHTRGSLTVIIHLLRAQLADAQSAMWQQVSTWMPLLRQANAHIFEGETKTGSILLAPSDVDIEHIAYEILYNNAKIHHTYGTQVYRQIPFPFWFDWSIFVSLYLPIVYAFLIFQQQKLCLVFFFNRPFLQLIIEWMCTWLYHNNHNKRSCIFLIGVPAAAHLSPCRRYFHQIAKLDKSWWTNAIRFIWFTMKKKIHQTRAKLHRFSMHIIGAE